MFFVATEFAKCKPDYERFDGKSLTSERPTGILVWMVLRRGEEEPMIGPAQVDMPQASVV